MPGGRSPLGLRLRQAGTSNFIRVIRGVL